MSPKPLIAAVDCGTSAVKAAVLDDRGRALAVADRAVPCRHFPDGRVEQDARQLKAAAFRVLRQVLAAGPDYARRVAAVAVTNQRATVVCTGADGEPLAPALSWQDMRGSPELARVRRELDDRAYFHLTGLPNHPSGAGSRSSTGKQPALCCCTTSWRGRWVATISTRMSPTLR